MENHAVNLPAAPQWATVVGWLGKGFVVAGVVLFLLAILSYAFNRRSTKLGTAFLVSGCAAIFATFASLAALFVNDQFQFKYVWAHSEKQNGLAYKVAAIWSGQEGSFLLWATASAVFLLLTLRGTGPYLRAYGSVAAVFLGALCGILAYESPFTFVPLFEGRLLQVPDGIGLAASLNNYWVIIHPPTIFLGFGSLLVPFAYSVAALIRRDYTDWVPRVRPWAIVSTTLVGLGLCMGGFWAYETLGWGGFWKWDPVENVSFVPWLLVTALVHGIIVQVTRTKWHFSNLLLGGLPFLAFCYGTFLTRAGFLDKVSVHSFAQMNASAHKVLLWFLLLSVAGFAGLWLFRLRQDGAEFSSRKDGLRRDAFYTTGNIFLLLVALATGIGMSVPLIQFAMGKQPKVVEEPLYHDVLVWFFVPVLLLMAIAPFVPWRPTTWREILGRVVNVFSLSLFVIGVVLIVGTRSDNGFGVPKGETIHLIKWDVSLGGWMLFLGWVCAFAIIANLWRLIESVRRAPLGVGPFLAHVGVATTMAGLIVSRGLEQKQDYALQPGLPALPLGAGRPGPTLELVAQQKFDFFDRDNKVALKVSGDGPSFTALPGLYYTIDQSGEPKPVNWPSIQRWASHDLYLVLHPLQPTIAQELTLKPGQSGVFQAVDWSTREPRDYSVTYLDMTREGEAGAAGTKFGARVRVAGPDGTVETIPKLVLGKGGAPDHQESVLDSVFRMRLEKMNAADKSVTLTLAYKVPVFPVELYYKPLTILIWLGVGILTLGGMITAWDRRRRPRRVSPAIDPIMEEEAEPKEDALVSVP